MDCPDPNRMLHEAGLRRTPARLTLLAALFEAKRPLTHREIFDRLAPNGVNRVTIYRTLESLREAHLVHRLESPDRQWRFGVCGARHPGHCHPHFTCRRCGRVECLTDVPMPVCGEPAAGYRVEQQQVYMTGLCPRCAKEPPG